MACAKKMTLKQLQAALSTRKTLGVVAAPKKITAAPKAVTKGNKKIIAGKASKSNQCHASMTLAECMAQLKGKSK